MRMDTSAGPSVNDPLVSFRRLYLAADFDFWISIPSHTACSLTALSCCRASYAILKKPKSLPLKNID